MKDRQTSVASLKLYLEASQLVCTTFPLQRQVFECHRGLSALAGSHTIDDLKRISDLRDEIFGCELEIACIQVRVRRIIEQVKVMRSPDYAIAGSP